MMTHFNMSLALIMRSDAADDFFKTLHRLVYGFAL